MTRTVKHHLKKINYVRKVNDSEKIKYSINNFNIGDFVTCINYENCWMIIVINASHELNDITVEFIKAHGSANHFKWPRNMKIASSIKLKDIL